MNMLYDKLCQWALVPIVGCAMVACKPSARDTRPEGGAPSGLRQELVKPVTQQERESHCISMARAMQLAQLVKVEDGCITGIGDSATVDSVMYRMGYAKSPHRYINLNGGVILYVYGCDVDEEGSIVNTRRAQANVVRISSLGQPEGSTLVAVSVASRKVFDGLLDELADLGFAGAEPEFTDGTFQVLADKFISGDGYIIQLSLKAL